MKAAIYARVSTKKLKCRECGHQWERPLSASGKDLACPKCASMNVEQSQDPDNQIHELREYCARQGWTVAKEYIDRETGKHSKREAFQSLFSDASKRLFDVVVVWALDRFTREGVLVAKQTQVLRALRPRLVIVGRARYPQQLALLLDSEVRVSGIDPWTFVFSR